MSIREIERIVKESLVKMGNDLKYAEVRIIELFKSDNKKVN